MVNANSLMQKPPDRSKCVSKKLWINPIGL